MVQGSGFSLAAGRERPVKTTIDLERYYRLWERFSTAIYLKNGLRAKLAKPVLKGYHRSGGVYPRQELGDYHR
jgi:hypothetical protein